MIAAALQRAASRFPRLYKAFDRLDADGKPLMKGYGQVVLHADLDTTKRWKGPGHVSILQDGAKDYIVYHTYDAQNKGVPTLRIREMGWSSDGWPVAKY